MKGVKGRRREREREREREKEREREVPPLLSTAPLFLTLWYTM